MSVLDICYRLASLHGPSVSLTHPVWCHQALRGAMKDPSLAVDPTLTIEFQKLFTAASRYREVCLPFVRIGVTMLPRSCALPACFPTLAYSVLDPDSYNTTHIA